MEKFCFDRLKSLKKNFFNLSISKLFTCNETELLKCKLVNIQIH